MRPWSDADSLDTWRVQGADLAAPVGGMAATATAGGAAEMPGGGVPRSWVVPGKGLAAQLPASLQQDSSPVGSGGAADGGGDSGGAGGGVGGGRGGVTHTIVLKPGDLCNMEQLPGVIEELQQKLAPKGRAAAGGSGESNLR